MPSHLIGLLLESEDDCPPAFESLVTPRPGPLARRRPRAHDRRIVNEPFDLRSRPRYSLVIDRLALVVRPSTARG